MNRYAYLILLVSALIGTAGCAPKLYPPRNPVDPVPVFVLDYGYHASLLLPTENSRYIEYVYADWPYGALNKTDFWHTLKALFASEGSAFGRREIIVRPGDKYPVSPGNPPKRAMRIDVARADVENLKRDLNARYESHRDTEVTNSKWGFKLVQDKVHYGMNHNCNHETGGWLRRLCVDVDGDIILSDFKLQPSREHRCSTTTQPAREGQP